MGKTSINVGGDAVANVIVTGDENRVEAALKPKTITATLPLAASVDIVEALAQISTVLQHTSSEQANKIHRALADALDEARGASPNKDEIGTALSRALDYAKKGTDFADQVAKLTPHLTNAVAWLGSNWHRLLSIIGLSV